MERTRNYLITLVVTKGGCTSTYTKTIIITQEVFSIAGPDKDICQGGLTVLNGQGPSGGNFSWTVVSGDPTSIDGGAASPNLNVSPLFTTVYKLTVSQNGCVRTDEVTVFVNVSLNPIANAGNPLEICSGVTTMIGGNPTGTPPPGAPNTALGYTWTPITGLSSSSVPNPTLTLTNPGQVSYQVIVEALVSGCKDTASVTHTILPNPTVSATAPEVCAGFTLQINSTPNGGTSGYTYNWSGPGGFTASTQNVSRTNATVSMSGLYNVTVTDSKGCVGNTSVQAVVNPNPTVSATAPEVCAGFTLQINSTPNGGTSGYTYNWSGPGGFTASTQNVSRTNATVSMSGLYNVTVTDSKGCVGNTSVQAVVNPNPTVSAVAPEVCTGFTLQISSTPNGGTSGYTYNWSGPGGFTANTQNVSRTNATVSMSGLYSVTVTDSKGCVGNTSVQAVVNPNPTVSALAPEVCAGFSLAISSTPSGGTSGYTYSWTGPNGYTANTQNISRANATVTMSGLYSVTVTDSKGCVGNTSVQATVNPNPSLQASSNSPVCVGNQITLFATLSSGTPGFTYIWSGPNGYSSTQQNPVILDAVPSMAGTYNVTVTDSKGCIATSNTNVTITPNPVSGIDGPPTKCAKEAVLFIASPAAGPGATYTWTFQGGTPANATGPSATSQWNTPGEYLITLVVTKDGCTSTYTKSIIITQEVFSVAGPDKEICQGGNVTLNGQGPAGASFSWTLVSGDGTSLDNGISSMNLLVSPLFTTTYRLTVSQNGCVRTDEVTVFVNVNLNPIANAGNPLDICSTVSTTIGGNPTGTPPPASPNTPLGYIWSPATGLNSFTVANPTLTLSSPGQYTYQVIVIALNTGCADTATVTHTIVPRPTITATTTEVCAGNTLVVNSTPSGGTAGYTYSWTGPNGYTANTQNINRANATVTMSGLYSVTVTDSKGCVGNTSVQAVVNPNPTVSATAPEVCAGSTLEISSTTSGGTAGYTYSWTGPNGYTANTQNISRANATISMSGLYNVTVTDSKGCIGNTSVQAVINPNPTVSAAAPAVCAGSTLEISSTPSGGTAGYTYSWTGPNGYTANTQNISRVNATISMSGLYSVTVTDSKGCVGNTNVQAVVEPKANVGDFVWEDTNGNGRQDFGEAGINGVQVTLYNAGNNSIVASTTTNTRNSLPGYYEFEVCRGSYYIIFGDVPGYSRTGKNAPNTNSGNDSDPSPTTGRTDNFTLNPGDNNRTIDAGYFRLASLGDYVWEDSNVDGIQDPTEDGISGVVVRLLDENSNQIRFTVTNIDGYYLFDNLAPGNYIVKFDTKPGYIPTAQDRGLDDAIDSDADPITGRSHLVTLVSGQSDLTIDAGFYKLARIGDFVWEDTNLNNRQDAFEPVLQGVEVTLNGIKGTDGSAVLTTTTTDNLGRYDFNNLTPGVYTVTFTRPGNQYLSVTPNVGSDDLDSDADPITGQTGFYNLKSGEYNNTVDAGYYRCSKVGDFVWLDYGTVANVQDAGDQGLNGVEVRLYNSNTNALVETQFTRNSPIGGRAGYYFFECVLPGMYYVQFIKPVPSGIISSYNFVQPNQGGNDILDSDVVNFTNGTTLDFTVGYAQIIPDIDAGLIPVFPVNLKELSGYWNKEEDVNELYWITAQEINNSHFIVERSFENGRFVEIGKVEGNGNTTTDQQYLFFDNDISNNGEYVYRIKQVDFDGKSGNLGEVSIKVLREKAFKVNIFPNPTIETTSIEINVKSGTKVSYELYDATGRMMYQSSTAEVNNSGTHLFLHNMSSLSQGIYYTKISIGEESIVQRIVKVD
ncbi:MAG: PKD domain-containing protein [Saprospiraceae bacterium]|nr:PKD domain-containing protein [Saprospiraceae bacterium]